MPAIISMLRGINLLAHNRIKMDDLRALYVSLKFKDARTHLQSGNVVFTTDERDLSAVAKRIEAAIEKKFGFRVAVILRTGAEMKDVIARNPFAGRENIDPSKLIVTFLAGELTPEQRKQLEAINGPEEIKVRDGEMYVYFPDGMGRSKLPGVTDRVLKKTGTARNWNTVTKLREMAEEMGGANDADPGSADHLLAINRKT